MSENNITNKRTTPLRNSNLANKPFRSPLTTVLTSRINESPKNAPLTVSPVQKSATPKRSISNFRHPIKRRRIDESRVSSGANLTKAEINDENGVIHSDDLPAIKRRICTKRQEIDNLKMKLNYIRKHKSEELLMRINKWRTACKEALFQFHKGIRDKRSENVTMRQVLMMLEIPEETVKFTEDECDLT